MSDRLAVFNHGRVEQVGPPAMSTSIRRTSSWPASSGRPTSLERDRQRLPSVPRRSVCPEGCDAAGPPVERGRIELVYLGMSNRFRVEVDGMKSFWSSARTSDVRRWRRSSCAGGRRRLTAGRPHVRPRAEPGGTQVKATRETRRRLVEISDATLALPVFTAAVCGDDDDDTPPPVTEANR